MQTLSQLQTYYAQDIVPKAVSYGAQLTFDPENETEKLPFPATFTNEFGDFLRHCDLNFDLKLYSNYPFSNKKDRELNEFNLRALKYFEQGNIDNFSQKEEGLDNEIMRVAAPVFMSESCVNCHNKAEYGFDKVWKVGDFRGVREVTIPIPKHAFDSKIYALGALFALGSILCGYLVVWPVISKLNRTLKTLKTTSAALLHSNNHDPLTGLPIVNLCRANLHQEIIRCREENSQCAVMFIDLDGFKQVNDTFGHDVGDKVLKMAAQRIQKHMRENDTPARVGGDEFAVMLSDITAQDTIDIASDLSRSLAKEYEIQSDKIETLSASIGIALYPTHGSTPDSLFKQADIAMYGIKNSGKNSFAIFDGDVTPQLAK